MKTSACIAAACAVAVQFGGCAAAPRTVMGAGGTVATFAYSDVETASGFRAHATHRFDAGGLTLQSELAYLDTGTARIDDTGGMGLNYNGLDLSLGLVLPGGFSAHDIVWFKGGLYRGDSELRAPDYGYTRSASGPLFGVGMEWMWTSALGLRLEYEGLLRVRDYVQNGNIGVLSLGLVFALPERRPAPAAAASPACPAAGASATGCASSCESAVH